MGIVEDVRFSDFIEIGSCYLPHKVMIEYPKKMKRVDINISETLIRPTQNAVGVLKEL